MSTDPEAALFEDALRADLPSAETERRLRRRLLAAGLAVGNGIASSTAVAAGTAKTSAASAGGLYANVVGLSWGIKLGFAAAVAIPTVGLLLDVSQPEPSSVPAAHVADARRAAASAAVSVTPLADPPTLIAAEPPIDALERAMKPAAASALRREAPPANDAKPVDVGASLPTPAPSQRDFAAPPVAAPPVAVAERATTLAEETRLLDAAFADIAAGNRKAAEQRIAEHEARYPRGLLSKERERAKSRLSELPRGQ
jgi:hypothetical protein